MKKIIPIIFIMIIMWSFINKEELAIPSYAIRLRIIANSDTEEDQNLKKEIKDRLEPELRNLMVHSKTSKEAYKVLESHLDDIHGILEEYHVPSKISLGKNYFPEKEYHGITYPSGEYDSLVITLGNGMGANWWCVMFPPLCLLENETNDNIQYRFFVKDIINKYKS